MISGTHFISRLRAAYSLSLALMVLTLTLTFAAPVSAQSAHWPTEKWVVMEEKMSDSFVNHAKGIFGKEGAHATPVGERAKIAEQHRITLEKAGKWYRDLGFPAPQQVTEDMDLDVPGGEAYLGLLREDPSITGSSHSVSGLMMLTSNPGFLTANTALWDLLRASAVHELYHGIQGADSPSLSDWGENHRTMLPDCRRDKDGLVATDLSWFVEGTAGMVQIRWLEKEKGVSWGHPFKGSLRAAWVRHFDQPLHRGSLPPERRGPSTQSKLDQRTSWYCSYGSWYFWYAVGDMIGRDSAEKVAYTRFLLNADKAWDDGGIANVDAGLKKAAREYDSILPYRGGLYALYPEFVAQYLTEDRFYGHLEKVELGAPGLYETTSSLSGGPLEPLASRAWRVRVRLPQNVSSMPHTVRFTLDAPDGTDRDALHLIVDDDVAGRPVDPTAPYAAVERTNYAKPTADGSVEYLVRVANVAKEAAETVDAEFSLRIEVDGFYGNDVSGGLSGGEIDAISGELPPGFDVRGPASWTCGGNAKARAIFNLTTPDERARSFDRALPQATRKTEDWLDNLDIKIQQMERQGRAAGMTREQLAALREQIRGQMKAGIAKVQPAVTAAADDARAKRTTSLSATFVGRNGDGECQMTLGALLQGIDGGAQIVAGAVDESRYPRDETPHFGVTVYTSAYLRSLRTRRQPPAWPRDGWEVCTMTEQERQKARDLASRGTCPAVVCTSGRLTLEAAKQDRITGTFQFEVLRWPKDRYASACDAPVGRDTVVGHFNVTSTDDGLEDKASEGLDAKMRNSSKGSPGYPILHLLPGGAD